MSTCVIERLMLGMLGTNCYMIRNEENNEIIVVDPGDSAETIIDRGRKMNGTIAAILLTHGHYDHILAVNELQEKTKARIYAMREEQDVLENTDANLTESFGGHAFIVKADEFLEDGQIVSIAGLKVQIIHTPGHTKGSGSYYLPEADTLLSGDTLFAHGYGRYDLPTGNAKALADSIMNKLLVVPDDVRVLPGHGNETTIGQEKRYYGVV